MAQSGSNKKVANTLVAISAAAVLAVYAAGYERTESAAEKLDAQSTERRPANPQGRGERPVNNEPASAGAGDVSTSSPTADVRTRRALTAPAPLSSPDRPAAIEPAQTKTSASALAAPPAPTQIAESIAPTEYKPETPTAPAPAIPAVVPAPVPTPTSQAVSVLVPPAPQMPAPPAAAAPKWKDGTYTGWGTCRHGDIQAEVIIDQGRITSARIAGCFTRYSCNVIGRLPPEVIQRQSAEVDYVSGATQSADAFYYAVTDALNHAK